MPGEVIDFPHPSIRAQGQRLAEGAAGAAEIARRCFEWVRDEIRHSGDFRLNPVTCSASEVLEAKTGYCYAKAHLLCALLRANGIPAGLCYQRLCLGESGPAYCLHGLAAVKLPEIGWYRVDPRGNKPGMDARFTPPAECLAYAPSLPGEVDFPEIWAEPLPTIVSVLRAHRTWQALEANLPDAAKAEEARRQEGEEEVGGAAGW